MTYSAPNIESKLVRLYRIFIFIVLNANKTSNKTFNPIFLFCLLLLFHLGKICLEQHPHTALKVYNPKHIWSIFKLCEPFKVTDSNFLQLPCCCPPAGQQSVYTAEYRSHVNHAPLSSACPHSHHEHCCVLAPKPRTTGYWSDKPSINPVGGWALIRYIIRPY